MVNFIELFFNMHNKLAELLITGCTCEVFLDSSSRFIKSEETFHKFLMYLKGLFLQRCDAMLNKFKIF